MPSGDTGCPVRGDAPRKRGGSIRSRRGAVGQAPGTWMCRRATIGASVKFRRASRPAAVPHGGGVDALSAASACACRAEPPIHRCRATGEAMPAAAAFHRADHPVRGEDHAIVQDRNDVHAPTPNPARLRIAFETRPALRPRFAPARRPRSVAAHSRVRNVGDGTTSRGFTASVRCRPGRVSAPCFSRNEKAAQPGGLFASGMRAAAITDA